MLPCVRPHRPRRTAFCAGAGLGRAVHWCPIRAPPRGVGLVTLFIRSFKERPIDQIAIISCRILRSLAICPYKSSSEIREEISLTMAGGNRMMLRFHVLAGLVLLGLTGPHANAADDYPARQIKIIVPFPAGAGPDQVARLIGQRLQEEI